MTNSLKRPASPLEPSDFDTWMQNPYTKVLHKAIAEDYVPRAQAKGAAQAPTDEQLLELLHEQPVRDQDNASWDDENMFAFARAVLARRTDRNNGKVSPV